MFLLTTVGKVIFNEILPESFPYINEPTDFNLEQVTPEKYFANLVIDEDTLKELESDSAYNNLDEKKQMHY